MVRHWRSALLIVALAAAACGGGDEPAADSATTIAGTDGTTTATAGTEGSTTIAAPAATSFAAEPTTTVASASTVATTSVVDASTTTTDGTEPEPPATFLAVTTDFRAVEVVTATGTVVRELGQLASLADYEDADAEIAPNAIDALWRTSDGNTVAVSECCEPAGGSIHYLGPDDAFTAETRGLTPATDGWAASPSPVADEFAVLGYTITVRPADAVTEPLSTLAADLDSVGSWASGTPAWSRDGATVFWIGEDGGDEGATYLHGVDFSPEQPDEFRTLLPWIAPGQALDGLTTQASGNLVGFLRTYDPDSFFEDLDTEGVVISPAGELLSTFPVELGSRLGGYDPSGTWLIYTDGEGVARWQGLGASTALGPGYTFVSW